VLLFALDKLNRALPLPDFSWKMFFRINGISILMNMLAGVYLALNQAELITLLQKITPGWEFTAGGLFAGLCGLLGSWILQFLVSIVHKGEKTAIGRNKPKG
jgi:hypothetical protein